MTEPPVYLVAYMDGAWDGYDPLSVEVGCPAEPADERVILDNLSIALDLMAEHANGKFVFAAHTGVYCRELFYTEPFLALYRQLVDRGGELALHPHEEVLGEGTLVTNARHMAKIVSEKARLLAEAHVAATAYRGGYGAYSSVLTPLLEQSNIRVDLSAAPGRENTAWSACWGQAPASAFYLCASDASHGACEHHRSGVLEIPLGWDGAGLDLAENYLWNENADLESMKRTWAAILKRHAVSGEPQFIHALSHLFSMGHLELRSRWADFLDHACSNGAVMVTPSEAKAMFDELQTRRGAPVEYSA